jgi:hypothetical protein
LFAELLWYCKSISRYSMEESEYVGLEGPIGYAFLVKIGLPVVG